MKHLWKGAVALALMGGSLATVGPGCVANESSIFIERVLVPSCPDVAQTLDSAELGRGHMDVRYSCQYTAVMVLGNQLVHRGDDNKLQTETSRVEIKAFDVQVLDAGRQPLGAPGGVGQFTVAATGFINPATNTVPGQGLSEVLLIDGATAQYLSSANVTEVVARVVARGRTLGGQDLASAPFDFPIDVCNGCLCHAPADDTCVDPQASPKEQCLIIQDFSFDCRFIGHKCTDNAICGIFQ